MHCTSFSRSARRRIRLALQREMRVADALSLSWSTISVSLEKEFERHIATRFTRRVVRGLLQSSSAMPKLRHPHIVSPDEVKITRDGDTVVFEYADPGVATTHLTMEVVGKLATMTDADLLTYWNEQIAATDQFIRMQKPITLTEIPVGKPQVEYSEKCDYSSGCHAVTFCGRSS
jgi:hypothetical protein